MSHINNGPCKLLKKDPTDKIRAKALKESNALKCDFSNNKSYHDRKLLTDLHNYTSHKYLCVLLFHIVVPHYTILTTT